MLLQRIARSGPYAYANAEAAAVAARMTVPPTNTRAARIDTLIGALKNGATSGSNIWAKCDLLYIVAAADAQAARLDWKSLGGAGAFNAVLVSTPPFVADRGYTNSSTIQRVDTPYNPTTHAVQMSLNSTHMGFWSRTAGASSGANGDSGSIVTGNGPNVGTRSNVGTAIFRCNDVTTSSIANVDGSGLFVVNRVAAGAKQLFRNGAQIGADAAVASTALNNAVMGIIGRNSGVNRQAAAWSVGAGLTAAEQLDYYNALQAYMTAVGA